MNDMEAEIAGMQALSSQELMGICDAHFFTAEEIAHFGEPDLPQRQRESYSRYVLALNELWNRGEEVREWARELLVHADFDAREAGAGLLGRLAERQLLGAVQEQVVAELGALIQRPVEADMKEMQAVDVAISALGKIDHVHAIQYIGWILFSTWPEHQGDTQWGAAYALGGLVGVPFMEYAEPVEAAREWLLQYSEM